MIAVSIKMVQEVQRRFSGQITDQYNNAVAKLEAIKEEDIKEASYRNYLRKLIGVFKANKDILLATPSKLKDLKTDFTRLPPVTEKKDGKTAVSARKAFLEQIHKALNYSGLRNSFYPGYFAQIGIKTCVYCNSQLAVTVFKAKGSYSARFDVDHHISKNLYPGLSISLFNLYPTCAPCNRKKNQNEVVFQLYTDQEDKLIASSFVFRLDPYAKAKFLLSSKTDDLDFALHDRIRVSGSAHEEFFSINSIYHTQKDVVEELILKSQVYDSFYRKLLYDKFSSLGISQADIERIAIGNYTQESDIHKRPLSKFVQDIAKELGII